MIHVNLAEALPLQDSLNDIRGLITSHIGPEANPVWDHIRANWAHSYRKKSPSIETLGLMGANVF